MSTIASTIKSDKERIIELEIENSGYEKEINSLEVKVAHLETKIDEREKEVVEGDEYKIGGMDTITVWLEKGNLLIKQEVESFIARLQSKYP